MAKNESSLFHLELIRQRNLSEQQTNILNAFAFGMQLAMPEAVAGAAFQLDCFCPPPEPEEEANNYLWSVWDIMLGIATSPDVTNEIHIRLVSILESLRMIAKGEVDVWGKEWRLWRDFPLLAVCMDTYFDDPILGEQELTPKSVQIWRNMNAFAARCLGAGVAGPYDKAMFAMQYALEEELSTATASEIRITECRVQIACGWAYHAAKPLLWWAQENIDYIDVPVWDDAAYVEQGTLYYGPATMCPQRWWFWVARLEEVGNEESGMSEEIRKAALGAAQTMRTIERRIFNTSLKIARRGGLQIVSK